MLLTLYPKGYNPAAEQGLTLSDADPPSLKKARKHALAGAYEMPGKHKKTASRKAGSKNTKSNSGLAVSKAKTKKASAPVAKSKKKHSKISKTTGRAALAAGE